MTGEALNIKLRLDFSDVKAGIQKVKSQLSGMADKVRQSIPKITTESKRAEKSLDGVTKEGKRLKTTIDGIGKEARDSLDDVVRLGQRAKNSLSSVSNVNVGFNADSMADAADGANTSLEELQGTMSGILALDFGLWLDAALKPLKTIQIDWRRFKKEWVNVSDLGTATEFIKNELKHIADHMSALFGKSNKVNGIEIVDRDQWTLMDKLKSAISDIRISMSRLKRDLSDVGKAFTTLSKHVGAFIGKLALLTAALAAVVTVINALRVSKLGREVYTASQQAGFATQSYQEWQYVLEKTGVEVDELKEMMKTLTESQSDVLDGNEDMINAYKKLGMSVEDVLSMNQEELWTKTIKALQNVENTTERTAIAYKLFSEDTAKLTTVLNLTNQETEQLISTYHELGGAMSKELIVNSNVLQGSLVNLRAAWQGLKNVLAQTVLPAVIVVVEWITKAIVVVSAFLKTVFKLDMTPMTENLSTGMNNVAGAAGSATAAVEKLKRTTMGFDELNIVTDPNAKNSDSTTSTNTSLGSSGLGNIDTSNSIFLEASKQAEELKKKIEDFVDKFKNQIAIIGSALGALSVAGLLGGLGKALGLGEKFLTAMQTIKKLAVSAITIVLQYELVNKFLDDYIDGKGFKNYLLGALTAAIGTGILYSMWGPAGLVIGLGVTAAASFKAVWDNGGITNIESFVVALTGIGSAIGAIATAIKMVNWQPLLSAFTSVKAAIAPVVSAIGTFVSGLGTGTILGIAAIIAGIAAAAYSLYENWDKVVGVVKQWFNLDIKPQLDRIKESWDNMKNAVKECGEAIKNAIPEELREKLEELWEKVKKVAAAFAEWFKSVEWIEGFGSIVLSVIGGTIMGVLTGLVSFIEGVIRNVSGWVQVVSGAIEAIVKLCQGDLDGARKAVKKIGDGIKDIWQGMYDATIGVIVKWVKGIIKWCTELWDELVGHSIIPDMVEDIEEWFDKLYENTIGVIVDWAKDIIAKLKKMWSDITAWYNSNLAPKLTKKYWEEKFDPIRKAAGEKLDAAKKAITDAWDGVATWFKSNVAPKFTKEYWNEKFDSVRQSASDKFAAAKKAITDIWDSVKSWFSNNVAPKLTLSFWQTKFDGIRKAASEKIGGIKTYFTTAWSSITSWFKTSVGPKFTVSYWTTKFNTIRDGAKTAFNSLIGIVERAINGIIDKLNTISWRIPTWVPYYGGSSFGFNLRRVTIPRLAQGGIATGDTLAHIGEGGYREAVLPLDRNTGWMDELAGKLASQIIGSGNKEIVIKIGETEFGRASLNALNSYMKQTGGFAIA